MEPPPLTARRLAALLDADCPSPRSAAANLGRLRLLGRAMGAPRHEIDHTPADLLPLLFLRPEPLAAWIDRGVPPAGAPPLGYERHALKSDASKKNMYSSLLTAASLPAIEHLVPPATRAAYSARLCALADSHEAAAADSLLTDREARSILPWGALVAAHARGRADLPPADRLLADLYLLCPDANPPKRLDYGAVLLLGGGAAPDGYDQAPQQGVAGGGTPLRYEHASSQGVGGGSMPPRNTLDLATGALTLRDYKTAKHHGAFLQTLPPPLLAAVRAAIAPGQRYLFQGPDGRPVPDNTMGRRLAAAMRRLTGVPVGASNLRKAYLSHLLDTPGLSRARLAEAARLMMHREGAQQFGYRRVDLAGRE